jgi:hypothetical protein
MVADQPDQSLNVGVNRGIISTGDYADNRIVNLGDFQPPEMVGVPGRLANIKLAADQSFIGREADLLEVGQVLADDGHAQVVVGEAGVGKSALAREFALRNSSQYRLVWWIDAVSRAAVDQSLAELAARLEPRLAQAPETAVQWMHGWLLAHDSWLIVADGAPGASMLASLLAVSDRGQVLVTSQQAEGWRAHCRVRELGALDAVSAGRLMAALADGQASASDADTAALCARLGYLPAAIEHVGRHLARTRTGPAQYLRAMLDVPVFGSGGSHAQQLADVVTAFRSLQGILKDIQGAPEIRDGDLGARIRDFLAVDVVARHVDAASLSAHWGFAEQVLKAYRVGSDARSALHQEIIRLTSRKAAADADRAAAAKAKAAVEERRRPPPPTARPRTRPTKVISDMVTACAALALYLAAGFVAGTVIAQWHSMHQLGSGNWAAVVVSVLAVGAVLVYVWGEALWRLGSVTVIPILAVPGALGWLFAHRSSTVTLGTLNIVVSHIGTAIAPWLVWRF